MAAPDAQNFVQDQQGGPDTDGAVGHIERWKVPATPVEIQKVDHIAVHQAVHHVADGAAQDERNGQTEELLTRMRIQHPQHEDRGHAKNENAAPWLCTRTKLKKEVMGVLSPNSKAPSTSTLVNWSSRKINRAMPSQSVRPWRWLVGPLPNFFELAMGGSREGCA